MVTKRVPNDIERLLKIPTTSSHKGFSQSGIGIYGDIASEGSAAEILDLFEMNKSNLPLPIALFKSQLILYSTESNC